MIVAEPKVDSKNSSRENPHSSRRDISVSLLAITAIVCSGLELEILMSLDGMMRFMTVREILWDADAALAPLFLLSLAWWLCLLGLVRIFRLIGSSSRGHEYILWRFGLIVPLIYFFLEFFNSARLQVFPHWHPGLYGWLCVIPILTACAAAIVSVPELSKLQNFCRTRLVPIACAHIVVGVVFAVTLLARGVYLFHDYVRPSTKSSAAGSSPDIYLVTLDALRAEDMSIYGYQLPTTPALQEFAQKAYTFDFFFANSNFTTPATTSIETGKLPWTHRVYQLGGFLRGQAQNETIASVLQEHGYYTASIASNPYGGPLQHKTLGSYDAVSVPMPANANKFWIRSTSFVGLNTLFTLQYAMLKSIAAARSYLNALIWNHEYPNPPEENFAWVRNLVSRKDITQPRFVWVHIFPPHDPYLPPPPYRGQFLQGRPLSRSYDFLGFRPDAAPRGASIKELHARYDENISYADHSVGDFLKWLQETGRLDRSIVIISADHGESFEHNWLLHTGPYLYNSLIHIPLLIHLPEQQQGFRVTQAAEQIDLLPTILDLVGAQIPSWAEGVSLKPALRGGSVPTRPLFSMNLEPDSTFKPVSQGTVAVLDDDFKYIDHLSTNDQALYRYRTDPEEEHNLLDSEPDVVAHMRDLLLSRLQKVNAGGQVDRR